MSSPSAAYYVLWVASLALQGLVAAVMIRRNSRGQFPFFFRYLVFQFLSTSLLFVLFHLKSYPVYFCTYWSCAAVKAVLEYAVVRELFDHTFRSFSALRDFSRIVFRWAALILAMMVCVMMMTSSATGSSRLIVGILTVERGVFLTQSGLLLFLLMYSSRLGITWKHYSFGIALGLGFNASVHLILNSLIARLGPAWSPTYNLLASLCYDAVLITWATYLFSPEPARATEAAQYEPKPVLQRWNQVLAGEDSFSGGTFIPNMERIVDRVMSRKH